MRWSDISFAPPATKLRQFAGLWLVFFVGLSWWQGFRHENTLLGLTLLVIAVTVGPLGLLWPQAVRPIYVGWMVAVFPIGWTVSRLVLAVLFYGVFTPLALLFRATGRDALRLRPQDEPTYWTPKPAAADISQYFRQF